MLQKGCFGFIFRATRSQTISVLNKSTVTQVPCRLVTCAECRHPAAPFVCPTIPRIKSNVGRNGNHHIVAFCSFRWPLLVFLYFGQQFRIVTFLCRNPDPGKMFYMAAVTNAVATVSSTSLVGLFLLSEYAWPTRVTPLLISCQKFVWSCGRSTFDDYRCTIPGTNFISYRHT